MSITNGVDDASAKWVERVAALLRQAESTTHQEEAAAFTAKATELITRHQISDAALAAASGNKVKSEEIVTHRFRTDAKYKDGDWVLVRGVVAATNCRERTFRGERGTGYSVNVFGFESDVRTFEILYASLQLQRTQGLLASKKDKPSWVHGHVWNREFFEGFGGTVSRRLREVKKAEMDKARLDEEERGVSEEQSFLPVLASKAEQLKGWEDVHFGKVRYGRASYSSRQSSGDAREAGRTAGERANIGQSGLRQTPGLGR